MEYIEIKCVCGNSGWFEEGATTCPRCDRTYYIDRYLNVKEIIPKKRSFISKIVSGLYSIIKKKINE